MSDHRKPVSFKSRAVKAIQDRALPAANTPWLTHNIHPHCASEHHPSALRVQVAVSTVGVFSVMFIRKGDTQVVALNEGDPLSEGALYVFEFAVHHHDRINFQFSVTSGVIQVLRIKEIDNMVAIGATQTVV